MEGEIIVKINGVFNLTDARYFAAAGADYLGFCIDENKPDFCSHIKIKEIISWLEGPKYVMETENILSEEKIFFYKEETGIHHLHLGQNTTLMSLSSDFKIFKDITPEDCGEISVDSIDYPVIKSSKRLEDILKYDLQKIKNLCQSKDCLLDFTWENVRDIPEFLNLTGAKGLILYGSEEIKTGYKDFEWMDEIMDLVK
jgi:phosphoribosylanthranilate isomerase